ncbi:MAG: hypothetical protein U9R42_05840 [Bacteroidota bacterium]|nr:hypothetical protein [Bacteroidota bacterium]
MKKIQALIIVLLIPLFVVCQDLHLSQKINLQNSVQIDLGGHGLLYSINYERIFINNNAFKTAGQIGISYYPPSSGIRDVWIPIGINELFSFNNHHLETGLGLVIIREATRNIDNSPNYWFWSWLYSGRIGYRYQKPNGRLILRVGFTPLLETSLLNESDINNVGGLRLEFHPLPVVSIGYNF